MVKLLLLFAFLASDFDMVGTRFARFDSWLILGGFSLFYVLLALGLFTLAHLRHHRARLAATVFLAGPVFIQLAYQRSTGEPLDYEQMVALFLSRAQAGSALEHFGAPVFVAACQSLILCAALALPPQRVRLSPAQAFALPLIGLGLLTCLIYSRAGAGARGFPPGYAPFSQAMLFLTQHPRDAGPFRRMPLLPPGPARIRGDLVLIVDESVGPHYLDLTQRRGVHSGLLTRRAGLHISNFGHAAAISGCSVYSNYLLRFGGTQQNYVTAAFQWPAIWAYARKAGFHTVYLDGQMPNGALQNMMGPSERAKIQEVAWIDRYPIYLRDHIIADRIARYAANGRRDFIYVNKVGAHFPIINKYPPSQAPYQPAPAAERPGDIWQAFSNPLGANWPPETWARYRNGYRNALAWSVGGFFDRLLPQLKGRKTTLIYTSDHGLDLHERGTPGIATHCTGRTEGMEQGLVPLVLISAAQAPGLNGAKAAALNYDRASAFRIFPTMLLMMGYDRTAVRAHYGRPLDEAPADRFARINRFNGMRNQPPDLIDIDLRQRIMPPASDYMPRAK